MWRSGDILGYIHANDEEKGKIAVSELKQEYEIKDEKSKKNEIILEVIE